MPRCSIHRRKCLFQTGPRLTATGLCRRPWLQLRNRRSLVLVARKRATGCASIHSRRLAFLLQLASSFERIEHHVVAFMAGVFVDVVAGIQPVWHVDCPAARPRLGIIDREIIAQLVLSNAREALGYLRSVAEETTAGAGLIIEIDRLDNQRVALPVPAGI